jgi:SanA protein
LDIKKDLITKGVDEEDIYLDYAGFSTLDSVLRAKLVFHIDHFTIISQRFHCERALYMARRNGLDAIGFTAEDIAGPLAMKVYVREFLARVKAILDIEVLNRQPKFLGEDPYHLGS